MNAAGAAAAAAFPHDPALPGVAAIRVLGLARAIPALGLAGQPVELRLANHKPGSSATFEVRAGARHLAVKAYAMDPAPEAELYRALAAAGLAGDSGPRVPRLVAWERDLRTLAITWLDGPTARELIDRGQGARAGGLAAAWLWRAASLPVRLGPPCGVARVLYETGLSVAMMGAADPALGATAKAVARTLARVQPEAGARRLVHGTLQARHLLDLGDGPGVIDWQRFGQGPVEVDGGMFLASISRLRIRHETAAAEAALAEQAFVAETRGLTDEHALLWYRSAALLRLASHVVRRETPPEARPLVDEAARLAERVEAPALRLEGAALELVLQALSTRPASSDELEQIRRLLDQARERKS